MMCLHPPLVIVTIDKRLFLRMGGPARSLVDLTGKVAGFRLRHGFHLFWMRVPRRSTLLSECAWPKRAFLWPVTPLPLTDLQELVTFFLELRVLDRAQEAIEQFL